MKRNTCQLEDRNGLLAVVYRTTSSCEPAERITNIYPTQYQTEIARTHLGWSLPLTVSWSQINQAYYVQAPGGVEHRLDTAATSTVQVEPYTCPKVRKGTETRYWCGEWQKFDKKTRRWSPIE